MNKFKKIIVILTLSLLLPSFSFAVDQPQLTRYLQKGSSGNDVLLLQQILNRDVSTQIATTGSGSPGNETKYFGNLTKIALQKYEIIHDLPPYNGTLHQKAREFINKISIPVVATSTASSSVSNTNTNASTTTTAVATSTEQAFPSMSTEDLNAMFRKTALKNPNAPFIESVSPSVFVNGDLLTIQGKNFGISATNTIRLSFMGAATTSPNGNVLYVVASSTLQNMFDAGTKNMSSKSRKNTANKIPQIPIFVTVQNDLGVSNAYQIYTKITP